MGELMVDIIYLSYTIQISIYTNKKTLKCLSVPNVKTPALYIGTYIQFLFKLIKYEYVYYITSERR